MASQGDKTILSKLAKNGGWSSNPNSGLLYQYQGFWYPGVFINGVLKAQEQSPSELGLSPSDTLLCSSPKSGTNWLKALAFTIVTRTRFDPRSQDHPLITTFPHALVPYIEAHNPARDQELPLLSSHMPYSALPKPISCKIVYICRNPKDVFVSLWHFVQKIGPTDRGNRTGAGSVEESVAIPLDKAFDLFCRGISGNGPYWDHVLGYWKASLDQPEKVMFLKYEDMMEDAGTHVGRLAKFIGCPFSEEEERDGIPARIVEMCSFGSLSELEVNKAHDRVRTVGAAAVSHSAYFRKAKVGDWRNYLTHEMAAKLDDVFKDKLGSFGLTL